MGLDPGDLGDSSARQLHADNVLVRAELGEHLGVDVDAGRDSGEVIDDDRYRAGIGKLY